MSPSLLCLLAIQEANLIVTVSFVISSTNQFGESICFRISHSASASAKLRIPFSSSV